ncbi:MAG: endo-1,4-beta-xylanase [Pseudomonadota bacterium]
MANLASDRANSDQFLFERDGSAQGLTRRSVLGGISALSAGVLLPEISQAKPAVPYGVATQIEHFRDDPVYRAKLLQYCDNIVPMNALKWASLRHTEGKFDFSAADQLIEFAEQNKCGTHGHTLLWYDYNPDWVNAIDDAKTAEKVLVEHIETVVDRYKGRIPTWDVVNEVIAHDPRWFGQWREGMWLKLLGPAHVDIAFRAAARTDPNAELIINDYDLANWGSRFNKRRAIMLDLVRHLQDQNIPVHGVGMQAHLYAEREVDHKQVVKFMRDLKALGVDVWVSELDFIDWKLSADHSVRDRAVAQVATQFLDAVFEGGPPRAVTTWGISDRHTWITNTFPRDDGLSSRALPLDENYQEKPLMQVLRGYLAMRA